MYIGGIIIEYRLKFSVCFDYFVMGRLWGCYGAFGGIMGMLWAGMGQSWGI